MCRNPKSYFHSKELDATFDCGTSSLLSTLLEDWFQWRCHRRTRDALACLPDSKFGEDPGSQSIWMFPFNSETQAFFLCEWAQFSTKKPLYRPYPFKRHVQSSNLQANVFNFQTNYAILFVASWMNESIAELTPSTSCHPKVELVLSILTQPSALMCIVVTAATSEMDFVNDFVAYLPHIGLLSCPLILGSVILFVAVAGWNGYAIKCKVVRGDHMGPVLEEEWRSRLGTEDRWCKDLSLD